MLFISLSLKGRDRKNRTTGNIERAFFSGSMMLCMNAVEAEQNNTKKIIFKNKLTLN